MIDRDCILCLRGGGAPADHPKPLHDELINKTKRFRRGEVLIRQDRPNDTLFYIHDGAVKLISRAESGRQVIHALLGAGDLAGISALSSGRRPSYSAEVIEEARLCVLERSEVLDLISTQPALQDHVFHQLTNGLEDAYQRNDSFVNSRGAERMVDSLLALGEAFGEQTERNELRIRLRLKREDLASLVGVSQETAIRILGELRRRKLLTEADHRLIILDVRALKDLRDRNGNEPRRFR
jgi:CRP/FNR family cyclic AMP-dependent transcriptional regulator